MNFIKQYLTVAILLLSLQSIAQKNDNPYPKRLYIGDTVPMESIVFNNVRNYPGGKGKLSDFKDKYIILDFWNRGCSSCIAAFPRMEELQKQFKDEVQILLVTEDKEEDLTLLLKNSTNLKNTKLPVVTGEQVLTKQLFPHRSVPFHVWLDRKGKVVATTYSDETNARNLNDLVSGVPLNVLVRNEIFNENPLVKELMDSKCSLLKVRNGLFIDHLKYYAQIPTPRVINEAPRLVSTMPNLIHYSMFMDYISGDVGKNPDILFKDNNGNIKGFKMLNYTLDDLYRKAYVDRGVVINKVIPEGRAKLFYEDIVDTTNSKRRLINSSFCYESSLPYYTQENAKRLLQQDLLRFFGMEGSIEKRPLKCLILTRLGRDHEKGLWMKDQKWMKERDAPEREYISEIISLQDGWKVRGRVGSILAAFQATNEATDDYIILDETNFSLKERTEKYINIFLSIKSFHCTSENIPLIRKELSRYGFGFIEENRMVPVMILKSVL